MYILLKQKKKNCFLLMKISFPCPLFSDVQLKNLIYTWDWIFLFRTRRDLIESPSCY